MGRTRVKKGGTLLEENPRELSVDYLLRIITGKLSLSPSISSCRKVEVYRDTGVSKNID